MIVILQLVGLALCVGISGQIIADAFVDMGSVLE